MSSISGLPNSLIWVKVTSEKLCQRALKEVSDDGFDVYSGGSGRTAGRVLG